MNSPSNMQTSTTIEDPISLFMYGLKAPECKKKYPQRLKFFFDFIFNDDEIRTHDLSNANAVSYQTRDENIKQAQDKKSELNLQAIKFIQKVRENNGIQWATSAIINFINTQNERIARDEITAGTVGNYYKAIKLFCTMNEIELGWKRIARGLVKEREYGDDRAPTIEEIIQVMKYPDRRIKPIVLVMVTSGIRGGAWDYLKWKHIIPIEKEGQIVAAKIIVYAGEPEIYYSFITAEAYHSLLDWMDFRASYGEHITGESWVMRDLWQTTQIQQGPIGLAAYPNKLKSSGIKSLMERAIKAQGVEKILKQGNNHNTRREWKGMHGYRKAFNSILVKSGVNYAVKEKLMGHDMKLDNNYLKLTEDEMLYEYLKADLIINEEFRLKTRLSVLEQKQSEIDLMKYQHAMEMRQIEDRIDKFTLMIEELKKIKK